MNALSAAVALVRNPSGFMQSNKDAPAKEGDVMKYAAVLAAIPFVATLIGDLWYFDAVFHVSNFAGFAIVEAVLLYLFDVAAVYILGVVIRTLASSFGSSPDPVKALKLAAYTYTPAFLIAVVFVFPILDILGILGLLYGLYVLYIGLPIMLGTPKEKAIPYVFVTLIAVIIIYFVFAAIIGVVVAAAFHPPIGLFY